MDPIYGVAASNPNVTVTEGDLNGFRYSVDEIFNQVQKLEQQVSEVEQFYQCIDVQINNAKDRGQEKQFTGIKRPLHGASNREANPSFTMQDLMRQFSVILHQMTKHKWAEPFLDPVDVEGLGLHDYYEVIEKPMDFSTIKRKMDAKGGSGYKNVREIYSDVRLIFKNAMKYNDEKHDVHIMAKSLLDKFEKKWLQLLPKVQQAESEQLKEEAQVQLETQLAQEATYASMARDVSLALCKADKNLKNLKEMVIGKCRFVKDSSLISYLPGDQDSPAPPRRFDERKLSTREKLRVSAAFSRLTPENLLRALQIISENDPTFQPNAEEVTLDLDAQSDYTVWRLHVFIKKALEDPEITAEEVAVNHNDNVEDKKNNNKRRRL